MSGEEDPDAWLFREGNFPDSWRELRRSLDEGNVFGSDYHLESKRLDDRSGRLDFENILAFKALAPVRGF